ncbi:hypothetical protein [Helicobacter felistomachi]|nr:hypothetical protein [Helicobacter sp. NHP21005]
MLARTDTGIGVLSIAHTDAVARLKGRSGGGETRCLNVCDLVCAGCSNLV